MSNLYNIITDLCKQKGITGGRMCTELGISKSTLTELKMGRQKSLSAGKAQLIADYLGVSVGYLLGTKEHKNIVPAGPNLSEDEEHLLSRREKEKAPTPEDERLIDNRNVLRIAGRDGSYIVKVLTDEQMKAFITMVDHLPDAYEDL